MSQESQSADVNQITICHVIGVQAKIEAYSVHSLNNEAMTYERKTKKTRNLEVPPQPLRNQLLPNCSVPCKTGGRSPELFRLLLPGNSWEVWQNFYACKYPQPPASH